ncbi:manganese and iron superoxide dismutase [Calocera cornea HHB12733]|uniref:Superoxide dismutase n=1 Tax=Calocera cornea HHB12733 TaxID=1353952 RepID=A0A165DE14_9BASI|nr:manganese and iron superoxide dismutase [Calocera cornea HHB12733]
MAKYTLPDLPYAYDALQSYISKEIMTLHHNNNHQASMAAVCLWTGHINHSLFWKNLAPTNSPTTKLSPGPLKDAIDRDFGSVQAMIKEVNGATAALQGSVWGWLVSHAVIIGIDIWEHAYYLDYKNVKVNYLHAIWHVMNFEEAEPRYKAAL